MKPKANPDSNLTEIEVSEQLRRQAIERFIDPTKRPKVKQNWLKVAIWVAGSVLVVGGLVVVLVYETNKPPKPLVIPSTFDPTAAKSFIGANDSVMMPIDNYTASAPPIFDTQTNIMTVPVPVIFGSSDVPNLTVEKLPNNIDDSLNIIKIDGLKPGTPLFSPYDGVITIDPGDAGMQVFFLDRTDWQKSGIDIEFGTDDGVTPLIDFSPPKTSRPIEIPVVKNQIIGTINGTSIQMAGLAMGMETFNLGVSGGKVILLTK